MVGCHFIMKFTYLHFVIFLVLHKSDYILLSPKHVVFLKKLLF